MGRIISETNILNSRGVNRDSIKRVTDIFETNHVRTPFGIPLKNCISKYRALRLSNISDGLLISLRGDLISFYSYTTNQSLATDDFVILKNAIKEIFKGGFRNRDDNNIESLEVTACDDSGVNVIVVEFSKLRCSSEETGGDGIKVTIPAP
jgi:hypothetical protein